MRYVALWTLTAALYALVFGSLAELPPWVAVLDGVVFGAVTGLEGLLLWNVLRYGTAESPWVGPLRIGTISLTLAAGVLFIVVSVGAETAVMWLLSESSTAVQAPQAPLWSFPRTIPARSLTVAAVYVCYVLWYSSAAPSDPAEATPPQAEGLRDSPPEDGWQPQADGGVADPSEAMRRAESAEHCSAAGVVENNTTLERITVRGTGGRIEVIPTDKIVFIRAEGDYVAIVTPTGRWLKEGTMKWFEEALPRDRFVRVHRSYIVSVSHISRIETSGRDHTLTLRDAYKEDGSPIRISDTGYRLLKRTLGL